VTFSPHAERSHDVTTTDREIIITRLIDAPRNLVFSAWTDPHRVDRWWGPRGFTTKTIEMDVRPGGVWRYVMRHAEHGEFQNRIQYTEIVAPERLSYMHGSDVEPDQFRGTIIFADEGGKTRLTMRAVFPSPAKLAEAKTFGAVEGGNSNLDRFEEFLAQATPASTVELPRSPAMPDKTGPKPELRMTRVFDAPKRLVFEAWSTAEHVARWFTPAPLTTSRCEVDLRPGGAFRLVMRMPDGTEHPMDASFIEVVRDERIVFEATIEGDLKAHTTVTFAETDGRTTLSVHQTYSRESPSTRGATAGWTLTLDQLAAHVQEAPHRVRNFLEGTMRE